MPQVERNRHALIDEMERRYLERAYSDQEMADALALYLGGRRLQQQIRTGQKDVANALEKVAAALRQPLMQNLVRAAVG
jgi:hypothetical protein